MRFGSLFSGIEAASVAWEPLGWEPVFFAEINKHCSRLLATTWPHVPNLGDVTNADFLQRAGDYSVDVLIGGDPCPCRSKARRNLPSKSPDLSGYFLAVAARLSPRWVVRENVPSSDACEFAICLELLGYRVVYLSLDSRCFTGQSRKRDFCIACADHRTATLFQRIVFESSNDHRSCATSSETRPAIAACLTAHQGRRFSAEDSYIYEDGIGLRSLAAEECERLQGFSSYHTAKFSDGVRRRMCGNSMTVDVVRWIGQRIMDAERAEVPSC